MSKIAFTDCVELVGKSPKNFVGEKLYISTGAVICNEIDKSQTEVVSFKNKPSRANLVAEDGDILFAKMQNTHKVLLLDDSLKEHIYSTGFCAVRANKQFLTTECLFYLLNSPQFLQQKDKLCSGATQKAITNDALSKLKVTIPALSEQGYVVANLGKIDALIKKRKCQLEKLDLLVKSNFNDMFGTPMRRNDKWKMSTIGEQFNVFSGGTPNTKVNVYWDGGTIPWIGSNMCQNTVLYENDGKFITEDGYANSSARWFVSGTVLVALVGATIGKVALLRFNTTTNQNIAGIEVVKNRQFLSEFIFYQLQLQYEKFMALGKGKFKMANQSFIRGLPCLCPPIELQEQFVVVVKKADEAKLKIKRSLEKLETLKKVLMQKYFG